MPTVTERSDIARLAREIVEHLHAVRQRLAEEIRSYPTPIPRCDAQFNHLYEQQGRLARELDRIDARDGEKLTATLIEEFVASAPYLDDASERDFRSRMKKKLATFAE